LVEWCKNEEIKDILKNQRAKYLNKNKVICFDHFQVLNMWYEKALELKCK
jgi:predicted ATPase